MTWSLFFTARKRAPWGDRYQWRFCGYDTRAQAERALRRLRRRYGHKVRIELGEGRSRR